MAAARTLVVALVGLAGCGDNLHGSGTLFVADRGGHAIRRYDAATGEFLGVFASGSGAHVDRPSSIRVGPDGELYMADFGGAEIIRYDAVSAAMMGVYFRDTTALEEPVELLFRGDELFVLGNDTNNVVVLDRGGALTRSFGDPLMRGAHDMAFGSDGLLYVGMPTNVELGTAIQVWDPNEGALLRHFGGSTELASATSIAFANDMLYVADHERDQIVRYDAATGGPRGLLVDHGLTAPVCIEPAPDGSLFVVDGEGVARVEGGVAERFIAIGDGGLVAPRSVTFVAD